MTPFLAVNHAQVAILDNLKTFHRKAVRVVVRTHRIDKVTARYKAAFRNVAFSDYQLFGIRGDFVGIGVEIAYNAVHH